MLSNCKCDQHANRPSVFTRITNTSTTSAAKKQRPRRKKSLSDEEYPKVTVNMVGSTGPSSETRKEPAASSSGESDTEGSPGLKKAVAEPEGVFSRTRSRTDALAEGDMPSDEISAIAESQSSSSDTASNAHAYMASDLEDIARKFEEQALTQKMQQDMILAQQNSISELKNMVALLLDRKKRKGEESSGKKKPSKLDTSCRATAPPCS